MTKLGLQDYTTVLDCHAGPVACIARLSEHGTVIASGGEDGTLCITDYDNGTAASFFFNSGFNVLNVSLHKSRSFFVTIPPRIVQK